MRLCATHLTIRRTALETLKAFAAFAPAFIAMVMMLQFIIERTFTARDLAKNKAQKAQAERERYIPLLDIRHPLVHRRQLLDGA